MDSGGGLGRAVAAAAGEGGATFEIAGAAPALRVSGR